MDSIFTKIIKGEIPCYKLAENNEYISFLDINPNVKGHALVIPKKQVDYIFDLQDDELAKLMCFAKKVASAIQKNVPCIRIGVAVVGLDVPHTHVHLIPLNKPGDMVFSNPKYKMSQEEFVELAAKIADSFNSL